VAIVPLVAAEPPTAGAVTVLGSAGPPAVGTVPAVRTSADERPVRHIRRLRLGACALARLRRDPHRLPPGWRSPAFAARVDRVRAQLLPIGSLAALADSYAREHQLAGRETRPGATHREVTGRRRRGGQREDLAPAERTAEVRLAYALRWLELSGVIDERPWRLHCPTTAR
jgi:hypothetical protein